MRFSSLEHWTYHGFPNWHGPLDMFTLYLGFGSNISTANRYPHFATNYDLHSSCIALN